MLGSILEGSLEIASLDRTLAPMIFSHAMGFDKDWMCAMVQIEIERAFRAISKAGNCGGIFALTTDDEDRFSAWGARYFAGVATGLITQALQRALALGGRLDTVGKLNN